MVEFKSNIIKHLNRNQEGISILTCHNIGQEVKNQRNKSLQAQMNEYNLHNPKYVPSPLQQVIDTMGELSAKAQGLKQVITTYDRLLSNTDNILYLQSSGGNVQGLLKIGYKKLFYRNNFSKIQEIQPLCVLDFYIHESCQRTGIGKFIFEYMLQDKNVRPEQLAYDRPSPKLISFLSKHYGLNKYIPQNNNFVIFDCYFDNVGVPVKIKTDPSYQKPPVAGPLSSTQKPPIEGTLSLTQKPPIGKHTKKNDELDQLMLNQTDNLTQKKQQQKVRFNLHQLEVVDVDKVEEFKTQYSQTAKKPAQRATSVQQDKSTPWATYDILDQYQTSSKSYGKLKNIQ